MSRKYELSINPNGIDRLSYEVLECSGILKAKIVIKINQRLFIVKRKAYSIKSLNKRVNESIMNLKTKATVKKFNCFNFYISKRLKKLKTFAQRKRKK